ncbi:MAG: branched-chain amino acid transaminase [archaeon]|nr:branched-chain amino acid transaminase [archaeon]
MEETEFIWMNGKMVPWKESKIHVLTHTLHYGSGVFEGIRCYETDKGPAIFRLKDHIKRLMQSAEIIRIKPNFAEADYEKACLDIISENKMASGYIRPIIYFGYGQMGLATGKCIVDSAIAAWPWGSYLGEDGIKNGIRAKISRYTRQHAHESLSKAKTTGNYFNSTLAKMDALETGFDEAIFLDPNGFVSECSGENLFMVKNNILITPTTQNALVGITRDSIMQVAKDEGIKIKEEKFTKEQLYDADEVFLTGTAAEVTPIREIDNKKIGIGKPGPITKKLQSKFFDIVHGKVPEYNKWLDYVKQ